MISVIRQKILDGSVPPPLLQKNYKSANECFTILISCRVIHQNAYIWSIWPGHLGASRFVPKTFSTQNQSLSIRSRVRFGVVVRVMVKVINRVRL